MEGTLPALVAAATGRARSAEFGLSCEPAVGRLLAVLAAHLPAGARVLELGTGAGVGTAWITWGLLPRTDVTVTTVEKDPQTAALAARGTWPQFVDLRRGDAVEALRGTGTFDLIFADAQGGKWTGLDRTIAALCPHGLLVVDDMTATPEWTAEQHTRQSEVPQALLTSPLLTSIELDHGSRVILATRHT
jgi:demethylmenaquinone methyltransferase/2-methoxy-6-polyprenyl-1,4-benzoquinol methylase